MDNITDEEILDYFLNEDKTKIISVRINKTNLLKNTEKYAHYLENRYKDFRGNYTEIVSRIFYNIDEIPRCKVCGKLLKYKRFNRPYLTYCSTACQLRIIKSFIDSYFENKEINVLL